MVNLSRAIILAVAFLSGCSWVESESKNAKLDELSISEGTLNPAFSADQLNYSATVGATTSSISVSAKPKDNDARVSINGADRSQGLTVAEVTLDIGDNEIGVTVSAEKRKKKKTYVINVFRPAPTYSIGGSVTGLSGDLTLQNNGTDDLALAADGAFTFATELDDSSDYEVTVAVQPAGQECTVANGSGTLAGADVSDVDVTCVDLSFSVGGTLTGLNDTITLQNNGTDDLDLTADGSFTFATPVDNGADYDVTISSQPTDQECTVTNGSGTVSGANVTNVAVNCGAIPLKLVAGVVNGLVGTVTLQLNGVSDLLVVTNGVFNFRDPFTGGENYDVQVIAQPNNQTCSISNNSGTIGSGHVLDIRVDCTGAGVVTGSIFDWEWINPLPQGNGIWDFASDGTDVVAVGRAGLVQTSTDGLNWTTRDSGTGADILAIAWGNGQYVAVGLSGAVLTSADGVTWQSQEVGFRYFQAITWTGTQFVAAGGGWESGTTFGPMVATSPDGSTWSFHAVNQDLANLSDIAWNGSLLVALQYPNILQTSPDGINWTATPIGDASTYLRNIASDGSRFVITSNNGVVFTSPDGSTWTQEAESLSFGSASELKWDESRFVALGSSQIAASADGTTWTTNDVGTAMGAGLQGLSSIIRHSGQNIIGHQNGAISTSPDDTSWTTTFSSASNLGLFDVIWDNGQFIALGDGPSIYSSPDGKIWTTRYEAATYVSTLQSVIWTGAQYIAVGFGWGEQVLTSPDGITWTPQTLSSQALSLQSIAWGDNQFVVVGQNGTVLTSPDGTTWTDRSSSFGGTEYLNDVAWNGNMWVATGYEYTNTLVGYTWTSPDGVTWTRQLISSGDDQRYFERLAWNGSRFVAVGGAEIGTSVDGLNWSFLQTNTQLSNVSWSGTEFLLTGYTPLILRSADGLMWTVERSISGWAGNAASDGTTTVLVDFTGSIVTNDGSAVP